MQLDDIIRYGMKPEYMFCLLINLIISRIIPISIKSVPYNFKSNWSTLRVCIENCVSFYAHQRALRFIIQPNPLQHFLGIRIFLLLLGKIRILIAGTCHKKDSY